MYLKFVSDGSVQKVGFSAVFMQEVDECKFANHGCEHECINTLGSYQCGCFAGYELQANGRTCEGIYEYCFILKFFLHEFLLLLDPQMPVVALLMLVSPRVL